jgi:hypothetical protein
MDNPLTPSAIKYTWQQLMQRAGAGDDRIAESGFEYQAPFFYYSPPDNVHSTETPSVIVAPCNDRDWQAILQHPSDSLDWLPARSVVPSGMQLPFDTPVPILFWGQGYEHHREFARRREDGSIVFYADIIAGSFFMLSRWEEMVVPTRDEHERFPGIASVAYRQGFLGQPIVDQYALILRAWLKTLSLRWSPQRGNFSVKLSHDIDHVRRYRSILAGFRALGGDIIKRQRHTLAKQTLREIASTTVSSEGATYLRRIQWLADLTSQHRLESVFNFKTASLGRWDSGYDVSSEAIAERIRHLHEQGFEIGLHPGYDTLGDPAKLAEEKARLEAVLQEPVHSGRQHYLRFRVPSTWRHWEKVGLQCDTTMGYPDQEGFRCGTCHRFHPFDVEQDRELKIWEQPLIVMDGALHTYRGFSPEQGEARILELAARCKQVEGTFTLLWHNSALDWEWSPWKKVYERVLSQLATL